MPGELWQTLAGRDGWWAGCAPSEAGEAEATARREEAAAAAALVVEAEAEAEAEAGRLSPGRASGCAFSRRGGCGGCHGGGQGLHVGESGVVRSAPGPGPGPGRAGARCRHTCGAGP